MQKLLRALGSALISLYATAGSAEPYIGATRLDFEYLRLRPENRDPYAPQYTDRWKEQAALVWDIRLLRYGYWHNRVHTETTTPSGTVKGVGWQWELGINLGRFDIYHAHHSRHIMDEVPDRRFENSHNQFPVEDAYGIRIKLLDLRK